ncbi:MAG: PilN domain-containing protein [Mycobacteriales bacterium]|nr:PilN domain-containing protein [Mycobacteriales bacterium]
MTAVTQETRLVGTGLALLPRVNLLPPEIEERKKLKQIQVGLGAAVLASVGVVGVLVMAANGSLNSANEELATATTQSTQLKAEAATYANVTAVYAQAAAAQALLTQAMGEEVRYSRFMNDLSLTVPDNVWVKAVAFSQGAAPGAAGTTEPGIGTVTFSGVGFSHDDVAVWLESLATQKGYTNPDFTNSTETLIGTRKTVTFTSTVQMTAAALSGRYTKPLGG